MMHVLSFYQRFQQQLVALQASDPQQHKHDLWFVMNGDWIDGTGLALNSDPSALVPILEKMPWDAINIGNHELYRKGVIEAMFRPGGFAEWWGPKYLSSNIHHTPSSAGGETVQVANRYRLLKGQHSNVLVFGFLYDMKDCDSSVTVQSVHDAINQDWFESALTTSNELEKFDAILVLAHMDHKDTLVQVILDRIRYFVDDDMPVQFVTGHTHYRGYSKPDNYSSSVEAGRFLDTVGFLSFPKQSTLRSAAAAAAKAAEDAKSAAEAAAAANQTDVTVGINSTSSSNSSNGVDDPGIRGLVEGEVKFNDQFEHVFIDAKFDSLSDALGIDRVDLVTEDGMLLTDFIYKIQQDLGLTKIVGCIEDDYSIKKPLHDPESLWNLYCNEVVPHVMPFRGPNAGDGNPKVVIQDNGAFRYNLYARELVLDEVIAVSPFNDTMFVYSGISGSTLIALNQTLNKDASAWVSELPSYIMCPSAAPEAPQPGTPDGTDFLYDLVVAEFAKPSIEAALRKVWPGGAENNTNFPTAVLMARTCLDMWVEFFDTTDLCKTEKKGTHKPKPPPKVPSKTSNGNSGNHNNPKNHDTNHTGSGGAYSGTFLGPGTFKDASTLDKFRMIFYGVAVCVVIFLSMIYARQRARIWRRETAVQEMATQEALDEFNETHGIGGPRYRDEDEAETINVLRNVRQQDSSNSDDEDQFVDEPFSIFPAQSYDTNSDLDPEQASPDGPPDLLL